MTRPSCSTCCSRWPRPSAHRPGATRVATDAGWTGYERQIGTTGAHHRPRPVRGPRGVGGREHVGGSGPPARRERQHRSLVPDDCHGRPGPGHRCRGRWSSWAGASAWTSRGGPVAEDSAATWPPSTPWWGGRPGRVGRGPGLARAPVGDLVERGPFPGSKNVYGGVVYGGCSTGSSPHGGRRSGRAVGGPTARRSMMTPTQSLSIDYRSQAWGAARSTA